MRGQRLAFLALVLLLGSLHGACGGGRVSDHAAPDSTRAARQRLVALESARSFGDSTLFQATRHPDPRLRRAAAMALGRIQDAAALEALLPLLDDADSTVVEQTAWALRQLQGLQEPQRSRLELALDSKIESEPTSRRWMFIEAVRPHASALSFAAVSPWVAAGLFAGMGSEARAPRLEGMAALTLANIDTERALDLLADLGSLTNRESEAAWRIAEAMTIRPDSTFLPSVLSLLRHPDAYARAAGARALSKYPDAGKAPALYPLLADPEWEVRASALSALGQLGDPEARTYCASMVADTHPLVREAALAALEKLGAGKDTHLVREVRADPAPAVRLAALRVLAKAEGAKARDAFEAARGDSVDFVRAEALAVAVDVLGAEPATTLLLATLSDAGPLERAQATQALGALGKELPRRERSSVRLALERALEDEDFVVAAQAADALGSLAFAESGPALVAAYQRWQQGHNGIDVRLAVLPALAALPGAGRAPATMACLESAQGGAEPRLVQVAREALAKLRGQKETPAPPPPQARPGVVPAALPPIDLGAVRVRLTTPRGTAVLELDGDDYPRTVANFLHLVDTGFYRDGVFHRVVPAFVVQGGCPRGDGWGDAGEFLPCEIGNLRYDREGIVGMAHAGKDTGGSQFFITHLPVPRLDGRYTAFGRVVAGMDVVDRILRGDRFRLERETPATVP